MKAVIIKLLHDFWLNKTKFVLCVVAVALSSGGIGGFLYGYFLADRDFEVNFRSTVPSDLSIGITGVPDSIIGSMADWPSIKGVERREVLTGRITFFGRSIPIILFGVEDFSNLRYNTFRMVENASESFDGIYIEQQAMRFINTMSEAVVIKFAENDSLVLKRSGVVHDAGLAPAQMEQVVYAYTNLSNLERFQNKTSRRLLIKTRLQNPRQQELVAMGDSISKQLVLAGGKVGSITIPTYGAHPHQGVVDGIAYLQKCFGAAFSTIGIILLSLVLLTWVFPMLPHVGIMKAIGASTRAILGAYVIVFVIVLTPGLMIGLPAGMYAAGIYNKFIAMLQNFEVIQDPLPVSNHLFIVAVAVLIPFLFFVSILVRVGKATVYTAINRTFSQSRSGWFKATQLVITNRKLKYAVNNLWRNNQRTLLAIALLGAGTALFLTGKNLEYSIKKDFQKTADNLEYNILINLDRRETKYPASVVSFDRIEKSAPILAELVEFESKQKGYRENSIMMTFGPDYHFSEDLIMRGSLRRDCEACFYVNQRMSEDFEKATIGEKIRFFRKDGSEVLYEFSGVVKDQTGSGMYKFSNDPLPAFNLLAVDIVDVNLSEATLDSLSAMVTAGGADIVRLANTDEVMISLENHLAPTYVVIQYSGIFTIVVGLLGILIVLNLSIQERMAEVGILKSIGCDRIGIIRLVRAEFMILNGIAFAFGLVLAFIVTQQLCAVYGKGLLGTGFPPQQDWAFVVATMTMLFASQYVLITLYCRSKIEKTSASLLSAVT
jgi:putative ABC transport system permease protein